MLKEDLDLGDGTDLVIIADIQKVHDLPLTFYFEFELLHYV